MRLRTTTLVAAAALLWIAASAPLPAVAQDAPAVEALRAEAHALRGEARLVEARARWDDLLRASPKDAEALDAAAELAEILGDVEGAVALRLSLLRERRDPWAAMTAAYLLRSRVGDVDAARRILTEGRNAANALPPGKRRDAAFAGLTQEEDAVTSHESRRGRIIALRTRQHLLIGAALIAWLFVGAFAWSLARRSA